MLRALVCSIARIFCVIRAARLQKVALGLHASRQHVFHLSFTAQHPHCFARIGPPCRDDSPLQ
eukprot:9163026-Pyramimonas_sp.AAC.1